MKRILSAILIALITLTPQFVQAQTPFARLLDVKEATYPYEVNSETAAQIMAKTNLTVAVDVTMPASISGRKVLVGVADPTEAAGSTAIGTAASPYVGLGMNGNKVAYITSSRGGDVYSANTTVLSASTNYKIVYVLDKDNSTFKSYINGTLENTNSLGESFQDFAHLATNENAKVYVGGGMVNTTTGWDVFAGQINSVQFFDAALDAEAIAAITYPTAEEDYSRLNFSFTRGDALDNSTVTITDANDNAASLPSATIAATAASDAWNTGNTMATRTDVLCANTNTKDTNADSPITYTLTINNIAGYKFNSVTFTSVAVNSVGNLQPATETRHCNFTLTANGTQIGSKTDESIMVNSNAGDTKSIEFNGFDIQANESGTLTIKLTLYKGTTNNGCFYGLTGITLTQTAEEEEEESTNNFYIAANTKQSDGTYINRYLYVNSSSALANATDYLPNDANYIWTRTTNDDGSYYFLNGSGKYLSYANKSLTLSDEAYSFKLTDDAAHSGVGAMSLYNEGSSGGKYMVMAADGTSFNQNGTPVNNGSWCSDYVFVPVDEHENEYVINFTTNATMADGSVTWNGETKTLPASFIVAKDATITNSTVTVTIGCYTTYSLDGIYEFNSDTKLAEPFTLVPAANSTYDVKFNHLIFSEKFGDTPVRIKHNNNPGYSISYITEDGTLKGVTRATDLSNTAGIWYLVGNLADGFKLQNMEAGASLALHVTATSSGTETTMTAVADATTWKLLNNGISYAIVPSGNTAMSLNAYSGVGKYAQLYDANDGGSRWQFDVIDKNPLTMQINVTGTQPYHANTRVAEMSFTINGTTTNTRVKGSVEAKTYYLPINSTFTLGNTTIYRGYIFDGFINSEGTATDYTDATIPEGGASITAQYSVDADNKYQYIYYSNDETMNRPYRIPAFAVTKDGNLLAVADHRPGGNDIGFAEVDIKIRRSSDYTTWTDEEFIANGTGQGITENGTTYNNVFDYGFGDAALVADRESDEVLIMCVAGKQAFPYATETSHNYMARLRSHDGGVNWDEPENVTAMFMDVSTLYNSENPNNYEAILPDAYSMFFASGRIFQSRIFKAEGSDYYRLYAALLVREVYNGNVSHLNRVVYSDDFGETWQLLGDVCVPGGDEAKCEELPDGTIIISSRKYYGRYFNIFTFTDIASGEGSWSTPVASHQQTGGISYGSGNPSNGEILKLKAIRNSDGAICDIMLQSASTGNIREKVTIYYKEMDYSTPYTPVTFAENWTKGLEVSSTESAYSTMLPQADGTIGFLYEEGPNGYCIVYVPLTIDEITNGEYSYYTVTSTIGQYEIGTFYASEAVSIPEGITAYVAKEKPSMGTADESGNSTGIITLEELTDGIIPANTGAIITGAANDYEFIPSISYGTAIEENMLAGFEGSDNKSTTYADVSIEDDNTKYILTVKNNNAGFYRKVSAFKLYNNKSYLKISGEAQKAAALSIVFPGGGTTGITNMIVDKESYENTIYDLTGRKLKEITTSGIYIVNGEKVYISK
ncbi:MAG: exo-alpha-sialidase [Bacteroidaceae bacterium]|nr:exo-alpha-sialidase [Bacteroidaceae bacterium]